MWVWEIEMQPGDDSIIVVANTMGDAILCVAGLVRDRMEAEADPEDEKPRLGDVLVKVETDAISIQRGDRVDYVQRTTQ